MRAATEQVKDWVLQNVKPRVGILTPRSFGALYRLHRPLLIAFVEGDMHEPETATTEFTALARKHYGMLRKVVRDETWSEDGLDALTVVVAEAKLFEAQMSGLGLRPGTKSIGVGILDGEGETTLKYRLGYDKEVRQKPLFPTLFGACETRRLIKTAPDRHKVQLTRKGCVWFERR